MIQFQESVGKVLKCGVKYRGLRRPLAYYPRYSIAIPHNKLQCIPWNDLAHNDHDEYVLFSTNLTRKKLSYWNGRLIFINLRPAVVHSPYMFCVWSARDSTWIYPILSDPSHWSVTPHPNSEYHRPTLVCYSMDLSNHSPINNQI